MTTRNYLRASNTAGLRYSQLQNRIMSNKYSASQTKHRGLFDLDNDGILTLVFVERYKGKKRLNALYQVLTTLPEHDYQELKSLSVIYFYLPDKDILGSVKDLPSSVTYVYLSSQLEEMSYDWITYCIAHELAHAVLRHTMLGSGPKELHEIEADRKAAQWGFECP